MAIDAAELERLLEDSGALQRGHFSLSSGLHSAGYVQCALLLEDPRRARRVAAALAARLAPHDPQSILAPALGGLVLGHEVAEALDLPFRFAERRGEVLELRRGFRLRRGERVAVVEDVVTTGGSVAETVSLARARGSRPVAVGALVDRSPGPSPFDLPFESLLRLELDSYPADRCPLCRSGLAAVRPGSRT